ncbi:DUF2510 domain-containing protein [Cellulosimicrobium sp. Marseille-Q4280]|uniref:DUF2510 domain-containing protein n=1 Tax=Cellulosimicrobium sp. Marseille-Q4280 TaxID=2937992 RepID=UPI00203B87E5|nr:DUF2510 domain-containing protein [Cellulosimicrobium sp. Marseille-Q4280]
MRKPPAGWYPDTTSAASERWFDGVSWTTLTRQREQAGRGAASPWWAVVAAGAAVALVVAAPLLLPFAAA